MPPRNNNFAQFDEDELSKRLSDKNIDTILPGSTNPQTQDRGSFSDAEFSPENLGQKVQQDGQIDLPDQSQNTIDLPETDFQPRQTNMGPAVTAEDIQQPPEQQVSTMRDLSPKTPGTDDVSNTAKLLADSIKQVESGGDPTAQGASGESGAFQFMPGTWETVSREITGQKLPQTPENEQMVAEAKLDQLLREGNSPREAALIWNTSLGGTEEPREIAGVNDQGVAFDSGAYAQRVMSEFQGRRDSTQRQQQTGQQFNLAELAQDTGPGRLEQGLDIAGDIGRGALNLTEGLGRAALSPIDTAESFAEGVRQGIPRVPSMLAAGGSGLITAGLEVTELPWEGIERIAGEENFEAPDFQETFSTAAEDWLDKQAKKFSDQARERIQEGQQFDDNLTENLSDPDFLAQNLLGRNIPTMVPAGIASVAGGVPAAFVAGGTLEGGAAMNEIRRYAEETGNEELMENDALQARIMGGVGVGAGMLDALGIEQVLDNSPIGESLKRGLYGRIARDVAKGVVAEGATEPIQEIVANAAAQTYNENRDLFEGAAEALVAGGLTGGAGSLVGGVGSEFVAQGMPVGLSIEDISDQEFRVPEEDRDLEPGQVIDNLIENSQTVARDDLRALRQLEDNLSSKLEQNPARKLSNFKTADGRLSQNARGEVASMDEFQTFEEAQQAFRSYRRIKDQYDVIDDALSSPQFSSKQVIQKVKQAESRTATQMRKDQERRIREELREQREDIERVTKTIKGYAKEFIPASERGRAMTIIENAIAAKPETRQKRLGTAYGRIREIADKARKKELKGQIQDTIKRWKDSPSVAPRFRQRIQNALEDVDLTGLTENKRQQLESTREFVQREGENAVPGRVLQEIARLEKTRWEDLSPSQLEDTLDEINRLVQLGRTKRQTQEQLYENEKQAQKEELVAQDPVVNDFQPENAPQGVNPQSTLESLRQTVHNAYLKSRRAISRFDKGVLPINALFRLAGGAHQKVKDEIDKLFLARNQRVKEQADKVRDYVKEKELDEKDIREIGVFLHRNRDGGVVRLRKGNELTEEEINSIELNEDQQGFVQLAYNILASFRDDVDRVSRELDNKQIEYVANYFPFLFDPDAFMESKARGVPTQASRILPDEARQDERTAKQTEKGFTEQAMSKEEVEAAEDYPALDLNAPRVMMRSISDMAHYVETGRKIRQLYEIFNSDEYKEQHGQLMQDEMLDWVSVLATQGGYRNSTRIPLLDSIKNNTTAATLGLKASTAMIQGTALVDAMLEVNPKNLGKGLYKMATSQKARDFVNKMPELEERVAGESALQDLQNSGKAKNKLINIGFKALSSIDKVVAGATAMGAYLDYAQQNDIDVDLDGDPDPDAMLHAQRAVEATQSNNQEKDKPLALSAGNLTGNKSVDNTLFQFQSFPMRRWAEFRVDAVANGLMGDGVDSKIDGARRIALITTAIALESGILMTLANAVQGEDEEDETFMGEMSRNAFQFVPLGGNLMSTVLYRSSPIPAVSFLNQSVRSVSGAVTAEEGDTRGRNAVEGLLQGIGVTTGLPGTIAQSRQVADRLFPEDNLPSQRGGGAFGDFGGFGEGGFDESSFEDTDFGGF